MDFPEEVKTVTYPTKVWMQKRENSYDPKTLNLETFKKKKKEFAKFVVILASQKPRKHRMKTL